MPDAVNWRPASEFIASLETETAKLVTGRRISIDHNRPRALFGHDQTGGLLYAASLADIAKLEPEIKCPHCGSALTAELESRDRGFCAQPCGCKVSSRWAEAFHAEIMRRRRGEAPKAITASAAVPPSKLEANAWAANSPTTWADSGYSQEYPLPVYARPDTASASKWRQILENHRRAESVDAGAAAIAAFRPSEPPLTITVAVALRDALLDDRDMVAAGWSQQVASGEAMRVATDLAAALLELEDYLSRRRPVSKRTREIALAWWNRVIAGPETAGPSTDVPKDLVPPSLEEEFRKRPRRILRLPDVDELG